jgi:hypothetical protein
VKFLSSLSLQMPPKRLNKKRSHTKKCKEKKIFFGDDCLRGMLEGASEDTGAVDVTQTPLTLEGNSNKGLTALMHGDPDAKVPRSCSKAITRFKTLSFQAQSWVLANDLIYTFRRDDALPNKVFPDSDGEESLDWGHASDVTSEEDDADVGYAPPVKLPRLTRKT